MTHDELLIQIDKVMNHEDWVLKKKYFKALRAVVELHKPNLKGGCDICSWIVNGFVLYEVCPTIQAIEKELG